MKMKSHALELSAEEGGHVSKLRPLLALCALAIIVLVGCKEPVGLPGNVNAASIEYRATVPPNLDHWVCPLFYHYYNGHYGRSPYPNGCNWIDTKYDAGVSRELAYSIIQVPSINCWTPEPVEVKLYYYQSISYGSYPITVVNMPHEPLYDPRVDDNIPRVWEYIWAKRVRSVVDHEYGDIAEYTSDPAHGWRSVTVQPEFAQYIINMAFNGGGEVYLGWVYTGTTDGAFDRNWGNGWGGPPEEYKAPYIRIGTPQ
jgi:hypothetical protein